MPRTTPSPSTSNIKAEGLCLSPSCDSLADPDGRIFLPVKGADRWCCYPTADPDACCDSAHTFYVRQRDEQVSLHLDGEPRGQTVVVLDADHLQQPGR